MLSDSFDIGTKTSCTYVDQRVRVRRHGKGDDYLPRNSAHRLGNRRPSPRVGFCYQLSAPKHICVAGLLILPYTGLGFASHVGEE